MPQKSTKSGRARKRSLAKGAARRAPTQRYKGLWVHVTKKSSKTKAGKRVEEGQVFLALGDADDVWVPILANGGLDHVRADVVERIVPKKPKVTAAQQAATKRLAKQAGVKVSLAEADRILRGER